MALVDLPEPEAGKGEVVVAVRASSVNPVDCKTRDGAVRFITGGRFPKVYGSDVAGIVHAVGKGVTGWCVGDSVYACIRLAFRQPGAHAERVAVNAKYLRRVPAGLTFEQAATLPVAALTALNGLRQCGNIAGKHVVIHGATGGVGHFAMQIAKARGARLTAVCSERNADRAAALGADVVIDYKQRSITDGSERFDVVFDAWGHLGFAAGSRVLNRGGIFVSTLPVPSLAMRAAWQRLSGNQRIVFAIMRDRAEDYATLESDIAAGRVTPVIGCVYPLEQAALAFAALERGGTVGKVVICVP